MRSVIAHKWFPYLVILFFFIAQIPFLQSDADVNLSHSRGAWTDEGLYTLQLRNWLNTGMWNLHETDAFLRAPLFNALLLPSFLIAGTDWLVARLTILLLVMLTGIVLIRLNTFKHLTGVILPALLFNPVVFHYSHLAMTEIPATCFLLMAMAFFNHGIETKKTKHVLLSNVLVVVTVFIKISFVYAAAILPFTAIILFAATTGTEKNFFKKQVLISVCTALGIAILFYAVWYLPNKVYLAKIAAIQSELKFDNNLHDLWERIKFTHTLYREDVFMGYSVYLFYVTIFLLAVVLWKRKKLTGQPLLLFCLVWLALELLKFINVYLPSRYLISTAVVNMLVFFALLNEFKVPRALQAGSLLLFGIGFTMITLSYTNRTFQIKEANAYFTKTLRQNHTTAVGNWASVCCWNSKVYSRYCVKDYANQQELLLKPKVQLILTETDEGESAGAFAAIGYDLQAHSDSAVTFKIANWQLKGYWMSQ
ncbi:MAG: hypothetical protein K1X81_09540 [Bacteroidia bacterium]|nr:hypothetical protein [Bacteroidia bacterium]